MAKGIAETIIDGARSVFKDLTPAQVGEIVAKVLSKVPTENPMGYAYMAGQNYGKDLHRAEERAARLRQKRHEYAEVLRAYRAQMVAYRAAVVAYAEEVDRTFGAHRWAAVGQSHNTRQAEAIRAYRMIHCEKVPRTMVAERFGITMVNLYQWETRTRHRWALENPPRQPGRPDRKDWLGVE